MHVRDSFVAQSEHFFVGTLATSGEIAMLVCEKLAVRKSAWETTTADLTTSTVSTK
jgi:hypothetical protein